MQHATVPAHIKNTYLPMGRVSLRRQIACRDVVTVRYRFKLSKVFRIGLCVSLAWAAHTAVLRLPPRHGSLHIHFALSNLMSRTHVTAPCACWGCLSDRAPAKSWAGHPNCAIPRRSTACAVAIPVKGASNFAMSGLLLIQLTVKRTYRDR